MSRTIKYSDDLAEEFSDLFSRVSIKPSWNDTASWQAQKIIDNKVRYRLIEDSTGVPWFWIGAVHMMESGGRFSTHLHNGDSLSKRTWRVPRGRPRRGRPPFTWESSAVDALQIKNLQNVSDWSLPRMLYEAERFNGFGYRLYHPRTLSPYLWSGSPLYRRGKYVSDGKWSSSAVSKQLGLACLLLRCAEIDESIDLAVPVEHGESFEPVEPPPVPVRNPERPDGELPVPDSFPKADEPRLAKASRKSRTVTGALVAAFGSVIAWGQKTLEGGLQILLETGTTLNAYGPAKSVLASLGGNMASIGFGVTVAGLFLVISRRMRAAGKGKIG